MNWPLYILLGNNFPFQRFRLIEIRSSPVGHIFLKAKSAFSCTCSWLPF